MDQREQEEIQKKRIKENLLRVQKHNATLIPERRDFVRTDGPRRQFRKEVLSDGTIKSVEI